MSNTEDAKVVTLETAVMECYSNKEFMQEYNRINGTHLAEKDTSSPLDILIDDATQFSFSKKEKQEFRDFIHFVDVVVWQEVYRAGVAEMSQ